MQIAPWEIPPDYLGAMRAGAGLGLERARLDTSANEAADRLRLAYTQLADNEDRAAQVAQSRVQQQGAALALKAQQQNAALDLQRQKSDMLDQYRNQRLQQFGTEEDRKQTALDALTGYRNTRAGQLQDTLDETTRHHLATEEISQQRADSLVKTGQGRLMEQDGETYIVQPNGQMSHVAKTKAASSARVTLNPDGTIKSASGGVTDPTIVSMMGTNAPPAISGPGPTWEPPPGLVQPYAGPAASLLNPNASPLQTPALSQKRVRVTGPNGQKGTIIEGDDLPDGWKLAE